MMMSETKVILVDEQDRPTGEAEKMHAHREGMLHRAFSVFIFNKRGDMLLQQRAAHKYHSGGLWTNACCSHPMPGEETTAAALRRLQEEMGFVTPVEKCFDFVYKASFGNGLTEYEFDHVYTGTYEGPIAPDKDEVADYCYKSMDDIATSLKEHPEKYTAWFHLAFPRIYQWKTESAGHSVASA